MNAEMNQNALHGMETTTRLTTNARVIQESKKQLREDVEGEGSQNQCASSASIGLIVNNGTSTIFYRTS